MARRLYKLSYAHIDKPAYIEDIGNTLRLSGVLFQGMGANLLLLTPSASNVGGLSMEIERPTLEEWCAVLDQSDDPVFFSEHEAENLKAIVRKQQRAIAGAIQQKVWVRDDFTCMYCGAKMGNVQLTVDHWIPLEDGGQNEMSNYLSACRRCNKEKGNISPETYCSSQGLDYDGLCAYLNGECSKLFIMHLA
jgi:hypothetical protein